MEKLFLTFSLPLKRPHTSEISRSVRTFTLTNTHTLFFCSLSLSLSLSLPLYFSPSLSLSLPLYFSPSLSLSLSLSLSHTHTESSKVVTFVAKNEVKFENCVKTRTCEPQTCFLYQQDRF